MSAQSGTPSTTAWTPGQCAQIQRSFVSILPDALEGLKFNPKDVINAFKDKDEILEQEVFIFLNSFMEKYAAILRDTGELRIKIPALPHPTLKEIQQKSSWIRSISYDRSPTKAVTFNTGTILLPNEDRVSRYEFENRMASSKPNLILGYQQAIWLIENQDELPEFKKLLCKIHIYFSGLAAIDDRDGLVVPCLKELDERWSLFWGLYGDDFNQYERLAFSGK